MTALTRRLLLYPVVILVATIVMISVMSANGASMSEAKEHNKTITYDERPIYSDKDRTYYNTYSSYEHGAIIPDLSRTATVGDVTYPVVYKTTGNEYCFGPEAYFEGLDLNDTKKSAEAYREDLLYRIHKDPALCAAIALACDNAFGTNILHREKDIEMGRKADHAHIEFLEDEEYRKEAEEAIREIFMENEIGFAEIGSYESGMYMIPNGLRDGVPAVTVTPTWHEGGHMLTVTKDGKTLKIRTTCGYQPIDVPEWNPPGDNPPPDNPPTVTTVTEKPPEETTTTTLKPKDPNDTVDQQDGHESFGGDIDQHDIDKRPTTQKPIDEFPDNYDQQTQPVVTTAPKKEPEPQVTTTPAQQQTEVRTDSQGTTRTYEVVTGKVDDLIPMEDLDTPADPVFENDPYNTGTFVAPE